MLLLAALSFSYFPFRFFSFSLSLTVSFFYHGLLLHKSGICLIPDLGFTVSPLQRACQALSRSGGFNFFHVFFTILKERAKREPQHDRRGVYG